MGRARVRTPRRRSRGLESGRSRLAGAKDEKSMERDYEYSSKCFLKDLDDVSIIQTRYKPLSQVEEKELTKSLDTELEDNIFSQFNNARKTSKNKKEFDNKLENLDLNLNLI